MLDIQFARSGDVHVAYHVVGDGPIDIVYVQGAWSHLEVQWELPAYRRFCELLGEFARVILFDKSGMGMSDRVPGATPLDVRMDDIRAVMDATGSDSASLIGASEGGPLSMLFAAAHPERTRSLVLMGAEVRERKDEEWPWGESTPEEFESSMALLPERWGKPGRFIEFLAPSQESTPWMVDWSARLQRNANTPSSAEAFIRMAYEIDIRDIVSSVRVPTLVLHTEGDRVCHVENGRYLAPPDTGRSLCGIARGRSCAVVRAGPGDRGDPGVPDRPSSVSGTRSGAGDGAVHRHRGFDGSSCLARR